MQALLLIALLTQSTTAGIRLGTASAETTRLAPLASPKVVYVQQPKKDIGLFTVAVKAGGFFPQPFSRLQASYVVGLEVGWAPPIWKRRFALAVDAGFTAPDATGTGSEGRLLPNAGEYRWFVEQRQLTLGLTFYYRHPVGRWIPYVGVGPRLYLLETKVRGEVGGVRIATSSESSSHGGVGIPLGVGVTLGPGHLFLELALQIGPLSHRTTGPTNTGALSLALGYRLVF